MLQRRETSSTKKPAGTHPPVSCFSFSWPILIIHIILRSFFFLTPSAEQQCWRSPASSELLQLAWPKKPGIIKNYLVQAELCWDLKSIMSTASLHRRTLGLRCCFGGNMKWVLKAKLRPLTNLIWTNHGHGGVLVQLIQHTSTRKHTVFKIWI